MKKSSLFITSEKHFNEEYENGNLENLTCCQMCKFKYSSTCKKICKWENTKYEDYLIERGDGNDEYSIDYITQHRYYYRIVWHKVGFNLYEWDILVRMSEKEDDYLGLTFGEERTLFPKKIW